MVVRVEVQPALFEWARERSGIGPELWNRRFPLYDVWVSGDQAPTVKQLNTFARKTYTPFGFFFLDGPPIEDVPIPDFRTIGDRPLARPSADLLDTVYVCQARQEWFRNHQLLNGEEPLPLVASATLDSPTADIADEMRDLLEWTAEARAGIRKWSDALTSLREKAETAGVLVMISGMVGSNTRRTLDPQEFRGFALSDPYAAVVFVNGADTKAAQVFTLAHELAHLWLGSSALDDIAPSSEREYAQERWCSQVAAELLAPMDEFAVVFNLDDELRPQLEPLAERFRVSTQVILGRVREAGHLTWDEYMEELRAERERVAEIVVERGTGGNFYYTKPVQVGKRFARELIASTLEGRTPYTEAFRLLGVKKTSTFDGLAEQLGVR